MPWVANAVVCAGVNLLPAKDGSNSPCTMLWARKPMVANSFAIDGLTLGL